MRRTVKISFGVMLLAGSAFSAQAEPVYGNNSDYHWVRLYDCVEHGNASVAVNSALPRKPEEACKGKARLREEVYYYAEALHREGGPALTKYDDSGQVIEEAWYVLGRLHRSGGPAERRYMHGSLLQERWYQDGLRSRSGGPAETLYGFGPEAPKNLVSRELWFKDGLKHRTDGPAEIVYGLRAEPEASGDSSEKKEKAEPSFKLYEKWYQEGKLHREKGPALVRYNPEGVIEEQKSFIKGMAK